MERVSSELTEKTDNSGDSEEDEADVPTFDERLWAIQCKREKSVAPKKIAKIVDEIIRPNEDVPYGVILAAACDFSKQSRDVFRDELNRRGVREYYLWGKADIEDKLFQPQNDHLLFAYFNVSLQVRRRSQKTLIRSRYALKRKLINELGDLQHPMQKSVLIRDPSENDYPEIKSTTTFINRPLWRYWRFEGHWPPDHVAFVWGELYGYANWDTGEWDKISGSDRAIPDDNIYGLSQGWDDTTKKGSLYQAYLQLRVPEENRAVITIIGVIPYHRILMFDEFGDSYNPGPHLLVDFVARGEPFENGCYTIIRSEPPARTRREIEAEREKQISYFPKTIPDLREEYREALNAIFPPVR